MKPTYVLITLGHRSFTSGKICIVEINEYFELITDYVDAAKKKACEKFGLIEDETIILSRNFLGEDVEFIK